MSIVMYTIGFIALLCSISVFVLSIIAEYPLRPEPELLVVDAPLPGEEEPAFEEVPAAEARA